MSMKIRLKGHIDVPPERMVAVQAALPDHIRLSRAEAGCISFEVTQSTTDIGRFQVAEEFIDRAAFDLHQNRTMASDWAKVTKGIAREYSIEEFH